MRRGWLMFCWSRRFGGSLCRYRDGFLMSVRGPTAAILSLRKPSLVFALRASLSAVQIRSRRICAPPKESTQRKSHPDAACFQRSSLLNGVAERGFLPLRQPRSKAPVLGAACGRKPYRKLKGTLFIFWWRGRSVCNTFLPNPSQLIK